MVKKNDNAYLPLNNHVGRGNYGLFVRSPLLKSLQRALPL